MDSASLLYNCVLKSQDQTFPFTLLRVWCSPGRSVNPHNARQVLAALCPGEQHYQGTCPLTQQ